MKKFSNAWILACTLFATSAYADPRETAFRSVTGPTAEQVPGGMLLWIAYLVACAAIGFFVWRLYRAQSALESEIADLRKSIERSGSGAA